MLFRNICLFVLINIPVLSQTVLDVPKFRIYPSSITQTEPVVTVSPGDKNHVFVSAVTIDVSTGFKSEGIYYSEDGGQTWNGNDVCSGASIYNHGGDPGVAITSTGRFILTHIGQQFPGMYSNYSDDKGDTWSSNHTISSNPVEDKGTLEIDNSPQSTYQNRLYLAFVDYVNTSVKISISADDGVNWSSPAQVNPNPPTQSTGSSIAIGDDGTVYLCWAGKTSANDSHEDYVGFARSSNGGQNWEFTQNIIDINGITGLLPEKDNIRVNSIPQIVIDRSGGSRDGWLYIVATEKNNSPAGSDPDIILYRSEDNGDTWSDGIRVNKDALNNGKIQYFPYLEVDDSGRLNMIFYDDRNTTSDSAGVFISTSLNGGDNWTEFELKNSTFQPYGIVGGSSNYQGDHIALISTENNLNVYWMADYTGIYQVWSAIIDKTVIGIKDETQSTPYAFTLSQNYPNPFNPSTRIKYTLGKSSFVTLKIYDTLGREIKTLVSSEQSSGEYEVNFRAENLPSGIYFYTLRADNFQTTKKLLLMK